MAVRILHLIGSLRFGGAQAVLRQIVECSDKNCFEHIVYPLRSANQQVALPCRIISNSYPNYDPRKFRDILRLCRQLHIDILHTHLHKDNLGGLLSTYFQKIPVIVHEHGGIFMPGVQYTAYRLGMRMMRSRAAAFIATSNATALHLTSAAGISPSRIRTIHNGVQLDVFSPKPEIRNTIRRQLNLSPQHVVVGFLGRLSIEKGPDILIDAAGMFLKTNPNLRLVIVGSGPLQNRLTQKADTLGIAKQVIFAGYQSNPADWLNAFDIGCIPSRSESFPLAALEMMSMKIPLLASCAGGLADILSDDNAIILHQNTPQEIADKLPVLATNAEQRAKLGNDANRFAQAFGVSAFISKLETLYTQVLADRL